MALISIKATVVCDACGQVMHHTLDPAAIITEETLADEVNDHIAHAFNYDLPPNKRHETETVFGGMCLNGIHLCKACYDEVDDQVEDDRDITEDDIRKVHAI